MAPKKFEMGATGRSVAANVARLRTAQNLTYAEASRRLAEDAEWSIAVLGLRRIEENERRVDVDDLVALAVVLGVTPFSLLMPEADGPEAEVEITGGRAGLTAQRVLDWLHGLSTLRSTGDSKMERIKASRLFQLQVHPKWAPITAYKIPNHEDREAWQADDGDDQ